MVYAFWKKSLRTRSHGWVDQACGQLGISRSTAYDRLRRGKKRASEFASVNDLADYLASHAPTRRLSKTQHDVINALVEGGMTPSAARKLEYRTRHLAKPEREARLLRALPRRVTVDQE